MSLSPGPPPWPIPPSWTVTPPRPDTAPVVGASTGRRTIVLLAPGDTDVLGAVPGVTVEARTLPPSAGGFAGVRALADAAARAFSEGAEGVVVVHDGDAPDETAWALDLLHPGEAPLVLAADPGRVSDVADAISVAAAVPPRSGCLVVVDGEIHTARHVSRSGTRLSSPEAGPLGRVTAGTVRLHWRPPERLTVRGGPSETRTPRVGLHTATLGDDGELLTALAERCDGLVVAGGVPDSIAGALTAAAARIPVVVTGTGPLTTTSLDPRKARVLMHLLLSSGRDRDAVLSAFTAAEGPGPAQV
jgi:L-asparaginase